MSCTNPIEKEELLASHCEKTSIKYSEYRPDIDALRAVAVIAVILFHAFPSFAPGGFVGVDIFFVISGYLISKHILKDLQQNAFSTRSFYGKRIKRIFPALTVVIAVTAIIGWIILTPDEYKMLGRPIAGGAAFVANFVFWKEAGYFDMAADTKPLLHLWSLGVEEQFYIIWPVLLALLWRFQSKYTSKYIFSLCALSIVYSAFLVKSNPTADFYSPITRFWELGAGAFIAQMELSNKLNYQARIKKFWVAIGVSLIAIAIFFIDNTLPFPGVIAAIPVLGAALVIANYSAHTESKISVSFFIRPLALVGLISYPLYLWHWPLLSYARIIESQTPSTSTRAILILVSFVLAWGTYKLIEIPIRSKHGHAQKKYVTLLCIGAIILFSLGVTIRKLDGIKNRVYGKLNGNISTLTIGHDRGNLLKECGLPSEKIRNYQFCLSSTKNQPSIAIIGDSKAEALYYGIARELKARNSQSSSILIGSIRPPREPLNTPADIKQQEKNKLAFDILKNSQTIKTVVLVIAMRNIFQINSETGFISNPTPNNLNETFAVYKNAIADLTTSGKKVIFLIDNPTFPDPRSCISGGMTSSAFLNNFLYRKENPRCTISYTDHIEGTAAYRQFAERLSKSNAQVALFDPTDILCDRPQNRCSITKDGNFLYSYSDHISDYANTLIAKEILTSH